MTDDEFSVTTYDVTDGVALITLNRPDRLNAWTNRMEREYRRRMAAAEDDPDVRVIVVTGAGRGFCAGADMAALDRLAGGRPYPEGPEPSEAPRGDWTGTFSFALGMSTPVIAAINGPAAGVGFVLACFADVRFAAAGAKLTTSFARLGLPAEHGISWVLPRLVGAGRAADILLSSRVVLAEEAERIGLVNRVLPAEELLPATLDYARSMARDCAPSSLATMKRQLWSDLLDPLEDSWRSAVARMADMIAGDEFKEGVAAWQERRTPRF